jgi:hypothetical protein
LLQEAAAQQMVRAVVVEPVAEGQEVIFLDQVCP